MWKDVIWPSLKTGGKVVLIQYAGYVAITIAIGLINLVEEGAWRANWRAGLVITTIAALAIGLFVSISLAWAEILSKRTERLLAEAQSHPDVARDVPPPSDVTGFVAMEYYALFLNRTYVVYVAPEGLYGWKVQGLVDTSDPTYYRHTQAALLDDPYLLPNREARARLLEWEKGRCFFIAQSAIVDVRFIPKPKWGMGPIVHSGRLIVQLSNGKTRELILLGDTSGEATLASIQKHGVAVAGYSG